MAEQSTTRLEVALETGQSVQKTNALKQAIDQLVGSTEKLAVTDKKASEAVRASTDEVQRFFTQQDKRIQLAARYQASLERVARWEERGVGTEQERAAAIAIATRNYETGMRSLQAYGQHLDKVGTSTGLARHELINLGRQAQDVFVSLAGGQSPVRVLVEQGTQIADIFTSSRASIGAFFRQMAAGAIGFATSATGIVTGVAAIGIAAIAAAAAWKSGQTDIERALIGIGQRSGVTVADVNKIAESASSQTRISTAAAREAAIEFIGTGKIYSENIAKATQLTGNFALAMGKGTGEAAKILAGHLADVNKGATELDKSFGFLDGKTRELLRSLVATGREQEAQALLMEKMTPTINRAAEATGFWAKAWAEVTKHASNAVDAVGKAIAQRGEGGAARLTGGEIGTLVTGGSPVGGALGSAIGEQLGLVSNRFKQTNETIAETVNKMEEFNQAVQNSRFDEWSKSADDAVRAMIPQIAQTENLTGALFDLKRARDEAAVSGRMGLAEDLNAAIVAAELLARQTTEAKEEAQRHAAAVTATAAAYGEVSVKTALALAAAEDQLQVAQARTGQERLAAEATATANRLIREGVKAEEAWLIAGKQRHIEEARITADYRNQIDALNDQLAVAQARTGQDRLRAQETAHINDLMRQGFTLDQASEQAAIQRKIAQEQINSSIREQTRSIRDQMELTEARLNNEEASVRAAQAYRNAIRAGADATAAAALSAAMLEKELLDAEVAATRMANAVGQASMGLGKATTMTGQVGIPLLRIGPQLVQFPIGAPIPIQEALIKYADQINARYQAPLQQMSNTLTNPFSVTNPPVSSSSFSQPISNLTTAIEDNTAATVANTEAATIGLSEFYTQQGNRLLGYRGYSVQSGMLGGTIPTSVVSSGTSTGATAVSSFAITNPVAGTTASGGTATGPYSQIGPNPTWGNLANWTSGGSQQIRTFAEGGVTDRPTFGVFGEAGPEAFVPLRGGAIPVKLVQPPGMSVAAAATKTEININAPLINFMAEPTQDEVRESAFQAAQQLRRLMAA